MNHDVPPTSSGSSVSHSIGSSASAKDLAALVLIEAQDTIYSSFEDGLEFQSAKIQRLYIARKALVVSIEYAKQARDEALARGEEPGDDTTVVLSSEHAEELYIGLTEGAELKHEETSSKDPLPKEALSDSYKEAEEWELTIGKLTLMKESLTHNIDSTIALLPITRETADIFLDGSEEAIDGVAEILSKNSINPTFLDTIIDENTHFAEAARAEALLLRSDDADKRKDPNIEK